MNLNKRGRPKRDFEVGFVFILLRMICFDFQYTLRRLYSVRNLKAQCQTYSCVCNA